MLADPDELTSRLNTEKFDVLVVEADFVFEETIQEATSLKLIGICRASTNAVDIDVATEAGICVINTPGRNAQAVAEHALGLMMALARNIPASHEYTKQGHWQDPTEPYLSMRGVELGGKTLGIIGLGAIGRHLAKIVTGIGMSVVGCDPYVSNPPLGVQMSELENLMSTSDFISVHVPLNSDTDSLVDAAMLSRMKQSAYLISCSDSAIIELKPLVDILRNNKIAGAAFDVFETHPIAPDNPLLKLDNVILTPHIGGATDETIERHSDMITDDIIRFLDGQRPVNLVNPEAWNEHDS
jgi:phosphoglycerate dehydrogenase-like enzyme